MLRENSLYLLVAAALFSACTPLSQRDDLNSRDWKRVASTLEHGASADDLVTAALINRVTLRDSAGALNDLDRSLKLDPSQPEAAWLALSICVETRECSQAPRSALLANLDPDNAAASYGLLKDARARSDTIAEDQALAAMAKAKYFDVYWSRLVTRTADALAKPRGSAQRPLREIRLGAVEGLGWLAGAAIPPFSATSDTCKGERLKRDDVVGWCRQLARVLDNGDTFIAQMIGRAIAKRAWPPESIELTPFDVSRREFDYLSQATQPHDNTVAESVENTQRWLNRFRTNRRERDILWAPASLSEQPIECVC
jgi:hypothetical protein